MKRFLALPIRIHMLLLVSLLALPAAALIINAGLEQRREAYRNAASDSAKLAYTISSEINILVKSAQQLADTLAHLPAIQNLDKASIAPLFADLIHKYPQYTSISITDSSGLVLASGLPMTQSVSFADRKSFKDAKASGRFTAGEYVVGKLTHKPTINFCYPFNDTKGVFKGVISIAINLEQTRHLLEKGSFPTGAEYVILDHKGIFLYRTFDLEKFIGTPIQKDFFKAMENGPDKATYEFTTNAGIHRVSSYYKLRLHEDQPPFMYVRAGFPIQSVLENANSALLKHLGMMIPFFALTLWIAWFISKRGIVDRVNALQEASHRLAAGDFTIHVSEYVSGSDLGKLAKTFDNMARSLADREQSLTESETKFRSLFVSLQEGVVISTIISDENGAPVLFRCIDVNPACEQILNTQREQLIGGTLLDLFPGPDNKGIEYIRDVATTGSHRHFEEYRAATDTWLQVHVIRPDFGHLAILFNDVTEQKKILDQRMRNEKLESLGVLAGGIAHDFNNFLTGIQGNVSLARMKLDSTHRGHKLLGEAEKACEGAAGLARQLLTFARGGAPIKKIIFVQQVLRDAATLILRGTNVKAHLDIPDSLQNVEADEGQITQVFHNIIINAVQAMENGGILTIIAEDVSLEEYDVLQPCIGNFVKVTFMDEGCGIAPDILEHIFDPYFTTKPTGTGLGLASSYSIITKHGGHINVISTVGIGTTFELYLPACEYKLREDTVDNVETLVHVKKKRNCRILVMDDDEVIRNLLVEIIEEMGHTVEACGDGAEAIVGYRNAMEEGIPYDAVIMDLTIPGGMGGKEAALHLLQLDPNACLIGSSGYSNDPIMSNCSAYGFCTVIPKPYNASEIGSVLDSVLTEGRHHVHR